MLEYIVYMIAIVAVGMIIRVEIKERSEGKK